MGHTLIWDATVTDTLAASYLPSTSVAAAAAVEQAADRKCAKYEVLSKTYHFVPLACKTLGPINNSSHLFITELGRHLSRLTGDTREPAIFISAFLQSNGFTLLLSKALLYRRILMSLRHTLLL